jgi:type II secretory ATPase GspE/PulE/Tfp pilus assembly ATPase PilB-like protein
MHLQSTLPIAETFTPEYLEYYGLLPLEVADGALRVAAARTVSREVLADLEETFGVPAQLVEVASGDITEALRVLFANAESTDALVRSLRTDDPPADGLDVLEADARDLANQPPVVRYVNLLIKEAHEARASDIHVEATAMGPRVRFRIDGVLITETAPPRSIQSAVVSRLKLIADLDIAERRVPQDGRIRIRLDARDLDLRVSTVPTLFGESIVLRLLDQGGAPDGLAALGMPDGVFDAFAAAARRAHGIVLATGPTGSGKTTTLYAALQLRDAEREKLITVEDPVEYRLPSVTQMPINRKADMTFAAGLRSILRQDPDVIMVGEMRDTETARIAVQAAMTGHLVFSTVHTNDAASAVTRLIDLGVEPYMLAATLQGVLAQRLVRRVCNHCAAWSTPGESLYALSPAVASDQQVRSGHGCAICRNTGFRGRVGIFEFLAVDEEIRAFVRESASEQRIREAARSRGVSAMRDDGWAKVCQGVTTPEEVLRAIQD